MKRNKVVLVVLIILLLGGIAGVSIPCFIILNNDAENMVANTISIIVGLVTFIGTMILGIIAYWQTKSSNEISKIISLNQMSSFVEFNGEAVVHKRAIDVEHTLKINKDIDILGVFCTTESKENILKHDKKDLFLSVEVFFNTLGAQIKKFKVNKLEINEQFKNVENFKQYYLSFNVLNDKEISWANYLVDKKKSIIFYLNCNFDMLEKINDNQLFVLDVEAEIESSYGVKQNFNFSLNIDQIINLNHLLTFNSVPLAVKIEKATIKQGDLRYE